MIPRVVSARYVRDYVVHVRFQDGTEGEVDLGAELYGEVFAPLRATERFRELRVDPELHTLAWPNGADFAPEYLYDKLRVPA
jgi:hypothetical protein